MNWHNVLLRPRNLYEELLRRKLISGGGLPVYEATSTTGVFYTDMVAPLKKLLVSLEPIQSGSGTPSPSNVRPIEGWTNVIVKHTGKNLFDSSFCVNRTQNGITTTLNADGSVTLNGTATKATRYLNSNDTLGLKLGVGTYTVTPANLVLTGESGNKKGTFTIDEEVTITNAYLTLEVNKTYDNEKVYMQIEKSSTATAYEPYQDVGYKVDWGKNLYSRENGEYNVPVYATDGTSASYPDVNAVWIKVKPNTTYYISYLPPSQAFYFRWINCDKNKGFISRPGGTYPSTKIPSSITTTATTEWVEIAVNQYDTGRISQNDWEICISESATDYEPYIGTVYGGTLDVVSGELVVDRAHLNLNTADMNNNEDYPGWNPSGVREIIGGELNVFSIPNTLTNISPLGASAVGANTRGTRDQLILNKSYFNKTQTEWQSLAIDVQFVIPLATPTTIQLTPQQIRTLMGNNTVTAEGADVTEVVYLTHLVE